MWCFAVSVGAVLNDSTVSVVSFDIAGTLKQKVGVAESRWVIRPRRGNFPSDWHFKSNGVVDPSVTVQPTDLGDI